MGRPPRRRRCAFTLIDVLVTMTVVAILIGIMLPGIGRVRELSKQVVCRSNLRQIGFGLALYADSSRDQLPHSVFVDVSQHRKDRVPSKPEAMMTLRLSPPTENITGQRWDGLGLLFVTEVLPSEQIFYCPSHHGSHKFTDQETVWRRPRGELVGNYHYRGKGPNDSRRLSFIEPSRAAIAADGMRTIEDYNHEVGLNVLRADLSLFWLADESGRIGNYLVNADGDWGTGSASFNFDAIWDQLDNPDAPVLPEK